MSNVADIADLPIASVRDDPSDHLLVAWCPVCQQALDAMCPKCCGHLEASGAEGTNYAALLVLFLENQRKLLSFLRSRRKMAFSYDCYEMASGIGYADGKSMKELARIWGFTKATVSKECHTICRELGLPPSSYMRNEETCAKFRLSNRRPRKT